MDLYVLVQCMLNPHYWHIINGDTEEYKGRLPYAEAMGIIRCMCAVREKKAEVLVSSEDYPQETLVITPDDYRM